MSSERVRKYDEDRQLADKPFRSACYAPFTSLYFDQMGFVRVCCQNFQHSLGNISQKSLDEIWNGVRATMLRDALKRYDFSLGCEYCKWQVLDGNFNNFARQFDRLPVPSADEFWPSQMEISISNTCNLECIMCNGEWSSSIRGRREKLPPLKKVYGDAFFEDLRKYLPHLKQLKFLGGEPFLSHESFRIWDMMIEDGLSVPCHVTTNGTQYNAKVQRILDHFPVAFSISMDGVTKATVEKVRVNAKFEEVLENFKRFRAYTRERGTGMVLTYCLMPANWREFGDYLLFGDEWDVDVFVNTVLHPPEHSFYSMSAAELRPVVEGMEQQTERMISRLSRNKHVWMEELDRVRNRMLNADKDRLSFLPGKLVERTALPILDAGEDAMEAEATAILRQWSQCDNVSGLVCDNADVVSELHGEAETFLGVSRDECLGRPFDQIYPLLRMRYGGMTALHREKHGPFIDRTFGFTGLDLVERTARLLTFPRIDSAGSVTLATMVQEPYVTAQKRIKYGTAGLTG
ncbi:MAG: radical SAM protein [Planctomycetota bacterium]